MPKFRFSVRGMMLAIAGVAGVLVYEIRAVQLAINARADVGFFFGFEHVVVWAVLQIPLVCAFGCASAVFFIVCEIKSRFQSRR